MPAPRTQLAKDGRGGPDSSHDEAFHQPNLTQVVGLAGASSDTQIANAQWRPIATP